MDRIETFAIHSYEVDAFGMLAVPALSGYLQEVAGLDAAEEGWGIEALMAKGLTWVLLSQRLEIVEPMRLGDVLEIKTWASGIDRLAALRDFLVRKQGGAVAAMATTQWLVLDRRTRRPVRAARILERRYREEHVLPPPRANLAEPAAWDEERRFHIRYQDIDVNLHVNNTSYVAWALEALPAEIWETCRLASMEVHYAAECRYGSTVLSRITRRAERSFDHSLVREEDGKTLARLRTEWAPRALGNATP